jgi:hypothetical protein
MKRQKPVFKSRKIKGLDIDENLLKLFPKVSRMGHTPPPRWEQPARTGQPAPRATYVPSIL